MRRGQLDATFNEESGMDACKATIFVVDDDAGVRRALARLLLANDFDVQAFESGHHFLLEHDPNIPGCILLDLELPGMSGLQVQDALRDAGIDRPIIFVTGHGDVPSSVRALKRGAVDFISKPIAEPELLAAISDALELERAAREKRALATQIQQRVRRLTPREGEVFLRVVKGRLNKQIAAELGTQERTIKVHRARVMRKMGARTLADLVLLASRIGPGEANARLTELTRKSQSARANTEVTSAL
jgi:FixJ family two-component response regulator